MLLADLDADVILVERPGGGDPARAFPAVFQAMARNKRSICLDLKSDTGKRQFEVLAYTADVVLEDYRPGVMDRLGLGASALTALNPRLIYASISGFGQSGPYRDRTAHDLSCQGVAGHLSTDQVSAVPYGDLAGAMFAALAIAAALFARERTGEGTVIDVSMADCLASWMTPFLGPALNGFTQLDLRSEPAYGVFTCRDGRRLSLSNRARGPLLAGAMPLARSPGRGRTSGASPSRSVGRTTPTDRRCLGVRHLGQLGCPPR